MTEGRRYRVQALFDQAVQLPPAQRPAFLDGACLHDEDLRAEVEGLLAYDAGASDDTDVSGLLKSPVVRAAPAASPTLIDGPGATPRPADAGEGLAELLPSRYQVREEVGRGGMGLVLRGRDTELDREVAVKVLLASHQHRADLRQRFLEEARISGQLQHPGV